jgi:hypothetical protein
VVAPLTVEGGPAGDGFRSSGAQVLAPRLRPGQVVLLDKLNAHTVAGLREALTATGAR